MSHLYEKDPVGRIAATGLFWGIHLPPDLHRAQV